MNIKPKRHQSKRIMAFAKGQLCQIRINGICNGNPETSVMCHLGGAGMGTKKSDLFVAIGCSDCHRCVDGDYQGYSPAYIKFAHYEGVERTQQMLLDAGVIKI